MLSLTQESFQGFKMKKNAYCFYSLIISMPTIIRYEYHHEKHHREQQIVSIFGL